MQTQKMISAAKLKKKIGEILEAIVDDITGDDIICRSRADAPEIDGQVFVEKQAGVNPGDIIEVKIEGAGDYDLRGRRV